MKKQRPKFTKEDFYNLPRGRADCLIICLYSLYTNIKKLNEICNQYDEKSPEKDDCIKCADSGGILTGLACIKTDFSTFISEFLLRTGVGFGGIIALGCIIYASITIQTSQGNPETIQKAREQIKSCLFGLLLILFSVLILQIIGVNILGLPGFK